MTVNDISRRRFIGQTAAGLGVVSLLGCSAHFSHWRFFTEEEAKLVEAITGQIIPADDDPGAIEAGVVFYIDKQLVGPLAAYQADYRRGLPLLQHTCRKMFGKTFLELKWEEQTTVLKALESGNVDQQEWGEQSPQRFFSLLRDHTMQGFYGSPRHGGNRNYISYKMLDLDMPYIIGQNRYRQS
ncbi:MAG TPA: gluconate 2-dehydrogenase subunit 3 family protein [bacterium]|nr:gluconate 2-dehydrogenase subunit 3 family protein [bacterium]HPN42691.1 gluconate 2-dehydrogenase subunit 3 family protein [bacterium]